MENPLRPLPWLALSQKGYLKFPAPVIEGFGFEPYLLQTGRYPPSAKPLKGLVSGALELIDELDGDA